MKNENYNLIKMLHTKLDDMWRLENYYLRDAQKAKCAGCQELYQTMIRDIKKHLELLTREVEAHAKSNRLK